MTPASVVAGLEGLARRPRRVRAGEALFRSGDAFTSLYAVREGFFQTQVLDHEGRFQVTGLFMSGELVGLDGISGERHRLTVVALDEGEVSELPYALIEEQARDAPALQREVHIALSREIASRQRLMFLLGSLRAEQRLASFLLDLSQRLQARGGSPVDLLLPMTRRDIGSYLGLALESVSRLFSALHRQGILEVRDKHVRLLDLDRLRALEGGRGPNEQ